jgi:hypothetical protein
MGCGASVAPWARAARIREPILDFSVLAVCAELPLRDDLAECVRAGRSGKAMGGSPSSVTVGCRAGSGVAACARIATASTSTSALAARAAASARRRLLPGSEGVDVEEQVGVGKPVGVLRHWSSSADRFLPCSVIAAFSAWGSFGAGDLELGVLARRLGCRVEGSAFFGIVAESTLVRSDLWCRHRSCWCTIVARAR